MRAAAAISRLETGNKGPMEQRRYPRIQLPLLVELKHPSLGSLRCIARDISEGGVFVYTEKPQLKPGAQVKLTLLNPLDVEAQPTPTVDMAVRRVEDDGLGLEFSNVTGRHLWQSVERLRTELAIGRDYFQVHLNALVTNGANALLLAQQHGRWTFPATFLVVGESWQQALERFLLNDFGVTLTGFGPIVAMNTTGNAELPEAAVLDVYVEAQAETDVCELAPDSRYRNARWTDRRRDVEESTFASELTRQLAAAALTRRVEEDGAAS
jgi:ADP-ribose pyrophosphatase YjhB (NUDIX family)